MKLHQLTAKQQEYLIRLCQGLETWRPWNNAVMLALKRRGLATWQQIGPVSWGWKPTDEGKALAK